MGCELKIVNVNGQEFYRKICDAETPCEDEIGNDGFLYSCPEAEEPAVAPSAPEPSEPVGCENRIVTVEGQEMYVRACDDETPCEDEIGDDGFLYSCPEEETTPEAAPKPQPDGEIKPPRDSLRFGSITAEGIFPMPIFIRKMGLFQPTWGGGLRFTLHTESGDRLEFGGSVDHTYHDRVSEDETLRYGLRLGLVDSAEIFRFGDSDLGADLDIGSTLYVDYQDNCCPEDGVAVGTETRLGVGLPIWRFRLGGGLMTRADIGATGGNQVPLNVGFYGNLSFNVDDLPTGEEMTPGARLRLRIWRAATNLPPIFQNAAVTRNVTHVDGLRDLDIVMPLLAAPHYGLVSYDVAQMGINTGSPTGAGVFSAISMAGGAAMEIAGIFADQPGLAGTGAAMFCGGAGAVPTAAGAEDDWVNKGTMIGCGALQAGVGLILYLTAPDLSSGEDDPLGHMKIGETPDDNPHADRSAEGRRTAGAHILSAGAGGLVGGFFVERDPENKTPNGAGINVAGRF